MPVNTVVDGSAKAWVNFNGTGTVAIRASFNVSSITDNGTGDYTVNFTNAMADTNYAPVCCGQTDAPASGNLDAHVVSIKRGTGLINTGSLRLASQQNSVTNGSGQDAVVVTVAVFR